MKTILNKIFNFLTGEFLFLPVSVLLCLIGFSVNTINYKMGYSFTEWYGFSLVICGVLLMGYNIFKSPKK